ncbi:retrovirus-related pol polyprotein from transposon TNT 1-94 [Tanacetum coccineum]
MKPKTVAQARKNMIKYLKNQGNYKISDFKGMSYDEIRPIFEKVWDFNQQFVPMDMEHETEKMKSPEKSPKKIEEEDADAQEEVKEVSKESGAKRKKSIPRKSTRKRQKLEEDAEKEELKGFLDIIPREEVPMEVESLSTKFPIVDWKTCVLTENFMYYQVFRGDGSSKNYKVLSEMLEDFDRQDVEELYRLVKERYSTSRPEGYDLMLWGDLHTLFEPDEDDEIWKNQHEYNKKKYPLSQEMISKMLKKKLEVDHESSQAFELLSFLISQQFSKGAVDPTLFTRHAGNDILLVQIYVDDIIFASTNTAMCDEFANQMTSKFKMLMMGQMSFFLGLQTSQNPRGMFINQSKYASEIGKLVDAILYRDMIGSLMYLTSSRPDLNHVVCLCARYQAKPTEKHLREVKRIFRYLNGTINMGLWYSKDIDMSLTSYADTHHAGCQDTRRSTSGSAQFLGDKLVSWSSKKQKSTAISSTTAEYIALSTEYQLADIFTKPLPRERFNFLINKLGMRSMSPEKLKCLAEEKDE